MNRRLNNRSSESGVALVITLIMMAVVTVMAIIFLAVTRRERLSVKLTEEQSVARMMAEVALERAKAEAVANMVTGGTKLNYDLFNSQSYQRPGGFDRSITGPDPRNVSYTDQSGVFLSGNDLLRMLSNLQYDPRVPVFVPTNAAGNTEFRFSLDFNRNRQFETNGFLPNLNTNGAPITANGTLIDLSQPINRTNLYKFVGDPEWVGVLERPDLPHSESNKFIGRYAFLALPAGKTLDANYAHNQVNPQSEDQLGATSARNGFVRNQGYGSWEINLAAFLRELNTNNYAWHQFSYRMSNGVPFPQGDAFNDARSLLDFRYNKDRRNLLPASAYTNFYNGATHVFTLDNIDNYADGPLTIGGPYFEDTSNQDNPDRPWPGSTNQLAFTDVQQLFTFGETNNPFSTGFRNFSTRLQQPGTRSSSYDRYTFYRMLSQLGVDSTPEIEGKLHLNYENTVGNITNNAVPWTSAISFFTNAVDLMLKASMERVVYPTNYRGNNILITNYYIGDTVVRPDISSRNIQLWAQPPLNQPYATSNEYTATIHRILQVAVNVYDSTFNRTNDANGRRLVYPWFPTALRPVISKGTNNVFISGFIEITNANFLNTADWYDLEQFATNSVPANAEPMIYGQPLLIGSKKGHPAFNELSLESFVQMSRKLELGKATAGGPVVSTNQMLLMSINNILGIEAWNSYSPDYRRDLLIRGEIHSQVALSNRFLGFTNRIRYQSNSVARFNFVTNWPGTTNLAQAAFNFQVPVFTNIFFLDDSAFLPTPTGGAFQPEQFAQFLPPYEQPHFQLHTTNRVMFWLVDRTSGRLVDFVNVDRLTSAMDIGNLFKPQPSDTNIFASGNQVNEAAFWATNRLGGPGTITEGMRNQIVASIGEISFNTNNATLNEAAYDTFWRDYNRQYNTDRRLGIDLFRKFLGLDPLYDRTGKVQTPNSLKHQAPFVPTRKYYSRSSWQVNDPFVRFEESDLRGRQRIVAARPPNAPSDRISAQNSNLRKVNDVYNPWGGGSAQGQANNTNAFRTTLKDPGIRSSDDWYFEVEAATNNVFRYPNVGYLGRVHRGTPWQTIYLKSSLESPLGWFNWAGRSGTHPAQDRRILEVFTVAPNENATRGLLSVNQTNQAAWSAVLSGLPVITFADPRFTPSMPITYNQEFIQPGSTNIEFIVNTINAYRALLVKTNYSVSNNIVQPRPYRPGFQHLGDVLGAPGLTDNSPYIMKNFTTNHLVWGMRDEMAERIPQTILSLLKRDEPRFVVYSYGQSLKPAPGSMETSANYYGLIKNYQITGEVITKTTFRVEGELDDPNQPLRAVVESYEVLPPPE